MEAKISCNQIRDIQNNQSYITHGENIEPYSNCELKKIACRRQIHKYRYYKKKKKYINTGNGNQQLN